MISKGDVIKGIREVAYKTTYAEEFKLVYDKSIYEYQSSLFLVKKYMGFTKTSVYFLNLRRKIEKKTQNKRSNIDIRNDVEMSTAWHTTKRKY